VTARPTTGRIVFILLQNARAFALAQAEVAAEHDTVILTMIHYHHKEDRNVVVADLWLQHHHSFRLVLASSATGMHSCYCRLGRLHHVNDGLNIW
jgi:hypothetical protein